MFVYDIISHLLCRIDFVSIAFLQSSHTIMTYSEYGPCHSEVDAALLILPGRAEPVPGPRI